MVRRSPQQARALGLWTAAWLFALLLILLLRFGDLSVEWPVLLVPLLWGLIAVRPRREPYVVRRPRDLDARDRRRPPPTLELPRPPEAPRAWDDRRQG